jgi:hypothetical protein
VELVLAVDVSRSVDTEEMEMQMRGYAEAFRDPRLAEGIAGGPLGAIAVTLFVWSDWNIQHTLVPWMPGWRARASALPRGRGSLRETYTSISGAIDRRASSASATGAAPRVSGDG